MHTAYIKNLCKRMTDDRTFSKLFFKSVAPVGHFRILKNVFALTTFSLT